jgi:NhaA family Na+:H+ antiporter
MNNFIESNKNLKSLFEQRVAKLMSPLEKYIKQQTTASILLIGLSIAALILSNSSASSILYGISNAALGIITGPYSFSLTLNDWVSQGLMALFFFLTGLEIKREILAGKLKDKKEITLICAAALGGILVPALIYYVINLNGDGYHGWGIPTATDTAFAIGVLALFASRVSVGLTIFLTALAIFDDIGAILIISLFYAHELNTEYLFFAFMIFLTLFLGNKSGIRSAWFYGGLGVLLWLFIFKGGIHPTFAGLVLAVTIPARTVISQSGFILDVRKLLLRFEQKQQSDISMLGSSGKHSLVSDIGQSVREASTPLQRWESSLVMPISIVILPMFAFLNAGFGLSYDLLVEGLQSPVTLGIIAGLVIGKPLGVVIFSYAAIKSSLGKLPQGVTLTEVIGVGMLAGIGFTMSIFFTTLSFPPDSSHVDLAKLGILISSLISATLGSLWICVTSRAAHKAGTP